MKVIIASTQDIQGGGGYIAAHRLHQGLQRMGIDSKMIVQTKKSDDPSVFDTTSKVRKLIQPVFPILNKVPARLYKKREQKPFSFPWLTAPLINQALWRSADVINLHWICDGFINPEQLVRLRQPIVWTLHDMWPYTGGCHFAGGCDGYESKCGACPQLGSKFHHDITRWLWWRKKYLWRNADITLVAPSQWMKRCASSSSLFGKCRIECIPNSIDTELYKPIQPKSKLREFLGLPQQQKLVLFGAAGVNDERKGFKYLLQGLQYIRKQNHSSYRLVAFGAGPKSLDESGFPTTNLGRINDEKTLALYYAACDVFLCPSTEDNLPNTVMEAMACAVPVVGFNIGGLPDMIDHKKTGYLAKPFDAEDLAEGVLWIFADKDRYFKLSESSRSKAVHEYALEIQAQRYTNVYNSIADKSG